jgi:hypothetical protein
VDEEAGSISDWWSGTVQSVGTTVANAWANAYANQTNPPPAQYVPASNASAAGAKISQLAGNPMALVLLVLLGFGVYKLARG